jgi:nucleotide-binding universal stress UspA family protein
MTHIALGYDGSDAARTALDWVALRAAREGARVDLITVTNMVTTNYEHADRELHRAEKLLHDLAPGVLVESHRVDGKMPNTLVEDARTADLLVIGMHRARPVRDALRGWMPQRLSARAHSPVCLVPQDWSANDQPVTVGVDDDPSSDEAIMVAAAEAAASGVPLRMVHAWSMPTPTLEGAAALLASPLQVKEGHRKILRDAVHRVQRSYPDLDMEEMLVADNPAAALMHRADATSLLVIGTHRRGVLTGGLLGSVAQDVLGQVTCPVMIVSNER